MSISHRTVLFAIAALIAAPLLSACGDEDVTEVTKDSVKQTQFVKDFRATFPKLAKNRTDETINSNGADTCAKFDDDQGERADVIKEISTLFTTNGIIPNDTTVVQIANMAVKDSCPDRAANLKAVL